MGTGWARVTKSQPIPVPAGTRAANPCRFANPWHSLWTHNKIWHHHLWKAAASTQVLQVTHGMHLFMPPVAVSMEIVLSLKHPFQPLLEALPTATQGPLPTPSHQCEPVPSTRGLQQHIHPKGGHVLKYSEADFQGFVSHSLKLTKRQLLDHFSERNELQVYNLGENKLHDRKCCKMHTYSQLLLWACSWNRSSWRQESLRSVLLILIITRNSLTPLFLSMVWQKELDHRNQVSLNWADKYTSTLVKEHRKGTSRHYCRDQVTNDLTY